MDAMLRGKAEELAKEIAVSISTQQELSDVMRLMTKSVIERMLDAEMDVHLDEERGRTAPAAVATTAATQDRCRWCVCRRSRRRSSRQRLRPQSPQWQVGQDRARRIGAADDHHAARSQRHLRAAADSQVRATPGRLRRQDSRALRQGHEHARHSRVGENALRRGALADVDFQS